MKLFLSSSNLYEDRHTGNYKLENVSENEQLTINLKFKTEN